MVAPVAAVAADVVAVPVAAAHLEPQVALDLVPVVAVVPDPDRKSTRLNSSHVAISYAVFCLKKKKDGRLVQSWEQRMKKYMWAAGRGGAGMTTTGALGGV